MGVPLATFASGLDGSRAANDDLSLKLYRWSVFTVRQSVSQRGDQDWSAVIVRQAERLETTRNAIVGAASGLFGRQGYAATTMDEIAAAAGVAKGAVYHHFPSKERLFEVVFDAATAGLAKQVSAAAANSTDVWDTMSVGTEAYFEACSAGPIAQIILKDGPAVLGWVKWREIDSAYFGRTFLAVLSAAMKQHLIALQPVEPLARLLLGAVTEAAAACAASATPAATVREHAAAFRSLIEGLRRRPFVDDPG
jgi:AcrR family transcriptional regulator